MQAFLHEAFANFIGLYLKMAKCAFIRVQRNGDIGLCYLIHIHCKKLYLKLRQHSTQKHQNV